MNNYNTFVDIVIRSLNLVENEYFFTASNNFFQFRYHLRNLGRFRDNIFYRYSERGFAYELYHQMRIEIDTIRDGEDFFPRHRLQGEIKKMDVEQVVRLFGYTRLGASYIPDLLFHIPSEDSNAFVIEIKSQPELSNRDIINDLTKLFKFLTRFNYARAIFIAVNITPENVVNLINEERDYLLNELDNDRLQDCHIIVKEDNHRTNNIFSQTLAQIYNV